MSKLLPMHSMPPQNGKHSSSDFVITLRDSEIRKCCNVLSVAFLAKNSRGHVCVYLFIVPQQNTFTF